MTTHSLPRIRLFYPNVSPFMIICTRQKNKIAITRSIFFPQTNDTVLSSEEKSMCEGTLTEKECLAALKTMDSNKTPGTDGLPAGFYKVFWKDISSFLIAALHYSFESGRLSISQRRGAIKLIPKKDAELYYIKNWRPITLLNTDYKIAAKAIANRVKSVLPSLINQAL